MATQDDVRRIALALPETVEAREKFVFSVLDKGKPKGFAWTWNERVDAKKPKVPNPGVLVVYVADEDEKQQLIAADPDKFFTEQHYTGYPAVLVRLAAIDVDELTELLNDAWRTRAPRQLLSDFDAG